MADVQVKVLFFAKARELLDMDESQVTLPSSIGCTELKKRIFREAFPLLADIEQFCILAVDQTFIFFNCGPKYHFRYITDEENVQLTADSEIAIIPPLSGG